MYLVQEIRKYQLSASPSCILHILSGSLWNQIGCRWPVSERKSWIWIAKKKWMLFEGEVAVPETAVEFPRLRQLLSRRRNATASLSFYSRNRVNPKNSTEGDLMFWQNEQNHDSRFVRFRHGPKESQNREINKREHVYILCGSRLPKPSCCCFCCSS